MRGATLETVVGRGAATLELSEVELRAIVAEALAEVGPGERVLAIVPDKTRDDNTSILFPFATEILATEILAEKKISRFDALIAQGTHGPMDQAAKRGKIGWSRIAPGRLVHIKHAGREYRRVVALLDRHYDELWVGGKASYKLGSIIEAGGELIIYAPHLTQLSATHGHLIEKYGYAPLEQVRGNGRRFG